MPASWRPPLPARPSKSSSSLEPVRSGRARDADVWTRRATVALVRSLISTLAAIAPPLEQDEPPCTGWPCDGHAMGCHGHGMDMAWTCLGHVLDMSWALKGPAPRSLHAQSAGLA